MQFYSKDYLKHDSKHECGKKNIINDAHVWLVDYNDIEQVEKMKDNARELIQEA